MKRLGRCLTEGPILLTSLTNVFSLDLFLDPGSRWLHYKINFSPF